MHPATKVVVLFGAGASAFSGAVRYRDELGRNPPLGCGSTGLFAVLEREGGIAATLPAHVRAALTEDFEAGMRLLEGMPGTWHVAFQRQIALHLASYRAKPGNHYLQLWAAGDMRSKEIQYSTLNYDMLLDQALAAYGLRLEGCPMDSPSPHFVTLLKLHGACNILARIENHIQGNEVLDASFGYHSPVGGNVGKLYLAGSQKEIERWCRDKRNEQFAPLAAQYVREKAFLTHDAAFKEMQKFWAKKVVSAKLVVLVGVRFVAGDDHIWDPLMVTNADLLVVDPSFGPIEAWGKPRSRQPRQIAKSFSEVAAIQEVIRAALSTQ